MQPARQAAADFIARRDREQRRHYARKPKKIADVLAQLITARGYGRIQADADFTAAWQQAAGETIAKYTRPGQLRRGTLEVTVDQLDDHPRTHLPKTTNPGRNCKPQLPDAKIRDLRFRVGSIYISKQIHHRDTESTERMTKPNVNDQDCR